MAHRVICIPWDLHVQLNVVDDMFMLHDSRTWRVIPDPSVSHGNSRRVSLDTHFDERAEAAKVLAEVIVGNFTAKISNKEATNVVGVDWPGRRHQRGRKKKEKRRKSDLIKGFGAECGDVKTFFW
jgi:hypothetical protein